MWDLTWEHEKYWLRCAIEVSKVACLLVCLNTESPTKILSLRLPEREIFQTSLQQTSKEQINVYSTVSSVDHSAPTIKTLESSRLMQETLFPDSVWQAPPPPTTSGTNRMWRGRESSVQRRRFECTPTPYLNLSCHKIWTPSRVEATGKFTCIQLSATNLAFLSSINQQQRIPSVCDRRLLDYLFDKGLLPM